jgi:hypothetical protein
MFALLWFCVLCRLCYIAQNVKKGTYKAIRPDKEKNLLDIFSDLFRQLKVTKNTP